MYKKLLKFFIILFFSFTMYGFSRPATEEDESVKWRLREGIELTFDYIPVSAFVYAAIGHDRNILSLDGNPDIGEYSDTNGEGYFCHLQFRTRGGGRTCLNFIWIKLFEKSGTPELTFQFDPKRLIST